MVMLPNPITSDHEKIWVSSIDCGSPTATVIKPMPARPLDSLHDFFIDDHHHQRKAAQLLSNDAVNTLRKPEITALIEFFEREYAIHIVDKDFELYPNLQRYCTADDRVVPLFARQNIEHIDDQCDCDDAIIRLKKILKSNTISMGESHQDSNGRQ